MKTSSFRAISICFIFSLLTLSGLNAQTSITVEGEITADTTWSADTVKVTGDLVINDDVIVTIEPGTRIEFQGFYEMEVKGTVIAEGNHGDSIIFTCHPDISHKVFFMITYFSFSIPEKHRYQVWRWYLLWGVCGHYRTELPFYSK